MNITQLYQELSVGKFSNLAIGLEGAGSIADGKKTSVLLAANEALLRLYTKFALKESTLIIKLVDHLTRYQLLSKFAQSSIGVSSEPHLYLQDSVEFPFKDDVIRILSVQTDTGLFLPLNDESDDCSVFTPSGNVLQVPKLTATTVSTYLGVNYQAKHVPLVSGNDSQLIDLPDCLHEALRCYIAYQIYCGMNTQESSAKAQEHLSMYVSLCNDAVDNDLVSTSLSMAGNKFNKRGWI